MRQHHTKVHGEPLPNLTCKACGSEFYHPKADRSYCAGCNPNAGEHNPNWRDAREVTECKLCDTAFEYYPSNKDGVYCPACVEASDEFLGTPSYEMRDIERIRKKCGQCGEEMEVLQSTLDYGHGKFCSIECRDASFSDGFENPHSEPYNGIWHRIRRRAYERDDHRCQVCGKTMAEIGREPDVHHITPIREYDDPDESHRLENVICLCRLCHRRAELGMIPRNELFDLL